MRAASAALALATLAGCAGPHPAIRAAKPAGVPSQDTNAPLFATKPYEPFSHAAEVAIALREWRLFGQPVDDDPPGTRPPPLPEDKPEREEGLWQRVGEYWWEGVNADTPEAAWTGKHDQDGNVFPASDDAAYAWSAAFVSYVMRIAGAGPRFPYSQNHATYINIAKQQALGQTSGWLITAERPSAYAPVPGDLICLGRNRSASLTYDDLPTAGPFPGHCDIVVAAVPGTLSVIGGNVDDAVTLKHVPTTMDGKLATPDGTVLDNRYPWMTVLRVIEPVPVPQTVSASPAIE